jgi:hypothetical protein
MKVIIPSCFTIKAPKCHLFTFVLKKTRKRAIISPVIRIKLRFAGGIK